MTLRNLLTDGRIRFHKTSAKETADLMRLVKRDLIDAGLVQLSPDRRFATAYNASLQLATIALHAAGYRTSGASHHWLTFHVLPEIMGTQYQARADYFDNCRTKRNLTVSAHPTLYGSMPIIAAHSPSKKRLLAAQCDSLRLITAQILLITTQIRLNMTLRRLPDLESNQSVRSTHYTLIWPDDIGSDSLPLPFRS